MSNILRRKTITTSINGVAVGSDAPVVVQSMTNTDTADVASTVKQVAALARAGSEVVRVTVNNEAAAAAVRPIVEELAAMGVYVPIVGDFHYNGHLLLKNFPECARALAKYRINPGNVSIGRKNDDNFRTMIECAIENDKPVRIGVNWGSLDQQLLTRRFSSSLARQIFRPSPPPGPPSPGSFCRPSPDHQTPSSAVRGFSEGSPAGKTGRRSRAPRSMP